MTQGFSFNHETSYHTRLMSELRHFLGENNHKNTPKSMLELTFAEIALSFCGYLYKEHILKTSSRMEYSILRYLRRHLKKTRSEIFKFEKRILKKIIINNDININLWLYMFTHL